MMFNSLVLISTSQAFFWQCLFLVVMCEIKLATLNVNGCTKFSKLHKCANRWQYGTENN